MTAEDPSTFSDLLNVIGWVPAVVFPAATVSQLFVLTRRRKADGVSAITWGLFAVANVCLYLTIGEWLRPQILITTLATAVLQVVVVMMILQLRRHPADKKSGTDSVPPKA
jgi:fatty acid desaturase